MDEHMFAWGEPQSATGTPAVRAAELAERILDEVSAARQDWWAIEQLARDLAVLAGRAVPGARSGEGE